ncbi:hypothetical protein AVEN_513-1 [Araneus ventricosus]|uniref:Uncharacterized protein n=1 Tax=Araneus ventricosus TaxID=182803 RepID=A0A4Y2CCG3_ARAVE|nr:hypothetical protein AVEN_513-1 [Araneus ventricosus]
MTNFSPDVMASLACWSANSFPGSPTWALTQERPTMFFALKMFDFTLLVNCLEMGVPAQVLSSSSDRGAKLRVPSRNSPRVVSKRGVIKTKTPCL